MNFLKLKYFVDMADCGSISAAARKNIIAQQSMSACLNTLEKHYGVTLFTRSTPLQLTTEGARLYSTAKQVLSLMDNFEQSLVHEPTSLNIGLCFSNIPPFVAEVLDALNENRTSPLDVRIWPDCADRSNLPENVELFIGMTPPEDCHGILLLEDKYVVAMAQSLFEKVFKARPAPDTSLASFRTLPFAAFTPNNQLPPFMTGLNVVSRSNNGDIVAGMCRKGKCAILIAQDYAESEFSDAEDILQFPVDITAPGLVLYVYYRKNQPLSEAAREFIAAARKLFADRGRR